MTDPIHDQIIENTKRKYIPSPSTQIFHGGVIVLLSLVVGLIYFQFYQPPTDIKPEDVSLLRQGFGGWLGLLLAICGLLLYIIWTAWRLYLFKREAQEEILKSSLERMKKDEL